MNDPGKRLAEQPEALLWHAAVLEAYMAQVRDVAAYTQALLDEMRGGPPAPKKPRPRKRVASR